MSTFTWLMRITRPVFVVAAGLATWVIAIVCNGPNIFSSNKIGAGIAMALNCLGASVFHFGAANRMYARKVWDIVPVARPWKLVVAGLGFFLSALIVAWTYLPTLCTELIACNIIILILYARILSSRWWTKNWSMAYVCVTPIILGWRAGSHDSPMLPFSIAGVFFIYWAREIIKDVHDIRANCGIRVTLPIRFGTLHALRTGGIFMAAGTICLTLLIFTVTLPLLSTISISLALCLFSSVAWKLLLYSNPGKTQKTITVGTYCLIVSILVSRL